MYLQDCHKFKGKKFDLSNFLIIFFYLMFSVKKSCIFAKNIAFAHIIPTFVFVIRTDQTGIIS